MFPICARQAHGDMYNSTTTASQAAQKGRRRLPTQPPSGSATERPTRKMHRASPAIASCGRSATTAVSCRTHTCGRFKLVNAHPAADVQATAGACLACTQTCSLQDASPRSSVIRDRSTSQGLVSLQPTKASSWEEGGSLAEHNDWLTPRQTPRPRGKT